MLSVGIDTHERIHYAEIQDEKENKLWRGKIRNIKEDFEFLIDKISKIEKSNNDKVEFIFMNPTGNYHVPLKYFLDKNNFIVYMVDARKTLHLRKMMNLNTIKSDSEDAHILAATPWHDPRYMEYTGHNRSSLSSISRERSIVVKSITAIKNYIHSDLAAVFPEFTDLYSIDSSTGMAILYEYATPYNIINAGIDNIIKSIKKASRGHYNMEDINKLMEISENSIGIPDEDDAYKFKIRMNISRLKNEMNNLKNIENEIISRSCNNKDVNNLTNLRGLGIINSAIIVSEIGNIEQFKSALKLESYAGKCPDIEGSGGKTHSKGITHVRNKFLSNAVYESAISLVMNKNKEFYDIFNREIGKKKSTVQAYIAVAKRLLFHIYSIMKNHKPYKEKMVGNYKRGYAS